MTETMEPYFIFAYCAITVLVFRIIGNILVIMSILRQKKLLKNNYHFLVIHLAINDLAVLIIFLSDHICEVTLEKTIYLHFLAYRLYFNIYYLFQVAGIGIMLFISVIRHRAVIHPLKPALSRRKMKNICCLVYIFGLIAGYGPAVPLCFRYVIPNIYYYSFYIYLIICYYIFPSLLIAVVYHKICRELIQQNKRMKNLCSNRAGQRTANTLSNILTFIRNKRTSLVSVCSVLCYAVGNIPMSVWLLWNIFGSYHLWKNYFWVLYMANVFRVSGSHVINPLIYGILDKKLLFFWKRSSFKVKPQGN